MFADERAARVRARGKPPAVGLLIALAAVAAMVGSTSYQEGGDIWFAAGASLAGASLAWAILWFGFVKRTGHKVAAPYYVILLGVGLVVGVVTGAAGRANSEAQVRAANASVRATMLAVTRGDTKVDTTPQAKGAAGEAEWLVKTYLADCAKDAAAYRAEIAALDPAGLFKAERLARDPGLKDTKARLLKARLIVRRYRALYGQRLTEAQGRIETTTMSDAMKAQARQQFRQGVANAQGFTQAYWDAEEDIVSQSQGAVDVLAASRSRWGVDGQRVMFARPADMAAFNARMMAVQRAAQAEAAAQAQARAMTQRSLDQLNGAAN